MSLYELVFIIRQDVSSSDVDRITEDFSKIIKTAGGSIIKNEYWGLRTLAYEINNNKKGHYILLGFETDAATINELDRKMKLSEDVIRFMVHNVEEISAEVSPILRGKNAENEIAIDVTLNKADLESI
ncbi:MAG: 30S ribosomal protein S6 [Pseudomonadota bacterium]